MRPDRIRTLGLILMFPLLQACGGAGDHDETEPRTGAAPQAVVPTDPNELKEIGQKRSGDYILTLFHETGVVKRGANRFVLEVRSAATNELVHLDTLHIETSMEMPGQPPMLGRGSAEHEDPPGRYVIGSDFAVAPAVGDRTTSPSERQMAGTWKLVVILHPNERIEFTATVN